ncbi:MAG: ZIP family metal transporter [Bacteroidales bacterium]|nr:ZIP family metal transporter [Bacteroidales bacterium]
MHQITIYTFLSIAVVSLISLLGIFTLIFNRQISKSLNDYLVGLAIGGLLAGAILHLLPETYHTMPGNMASILILAGLIFFFLFEKILHSKLDKVKHHVKVYGPINLVADFFHNFLDGILIAVAFQVSVQAGIAATLAIALHEIPQELGDYGVLLKAGYSHKKALLFNFLSALSSFIGAACVLLIPKTYEHFIPYLFPISVAGFLYLALSNLLPELHKTKGNRIWLIQLAGIATGIVFLIILMTSNGHHHHH